MSKADGTYKPQEGETYVEMLRRHDKECQQFILDKTKPTLLYVIIQYKYGDGHMDMDLVKSLLRGYNVIPITAYHNDANFIIAMAQRYVVNFILIPKEMRPALVAEIQDRSPVGTTLIRKVFGGYERILKVEIRTEPWLNPKDSNLKKYSSDNNAWPLYLTLSETEAEGIIGVRYPYKPLTEEEFSYWENREDNQKVEFDEIVEKTSRE